MISDADVAAFRDRGLLRLPAVADPAGLAAARGAVFDILSRAGLWTEGEGWTLAGADRPRWPALGKAPAAFKDRRLATVLETLVPADLIASLDTLAGAKMGTAGGLSRPQLLWTLPNAAAWSLPAILWHTDVPRTPQAGCPGVQVFSFLSPVAPGAGATLVAAGSHRPLNDQGELRSKEIKARLRALPPFAAPNASKAPRLMMTWRFLREG